MIHTLFLNDRVFQDSSSPIHTTGTAESWFEEHEGELQHLPWLAQSPDMNFTELLWPVLETTVRHRFPPSRYLKQLEEVLQEEWFKILLETVQNLYGSISRKNATVLKAKGGPTPY
jgi:hypothetical protein